MTRLALQATIFIKGMTSQKRVEVKDLSYDPEIQAFCYISEDDLICWILREYVHSWVEVR